ncbi:hypothetical protein CHLNCDRAFT_140838 [Chlorella variabilis]|uniref:Uncharacterized protein n=1 Tax=Chlorella variabilis TaxID=554065 RepID=E1Z6B5_CHLVA|nr:hypothetical protein CHLNCDRAFT_140838 [Chlorella variabilis]EFN58902.1 hypothetical protein CHLNCDRAFT_140838 [Chlorella variabilis]|eukprot:XP_005851004.1 hypothetical protein CHLNCDRAFT_140838 [Chlorella variabilis]
MAPPQRPKSSNRLVAAGLVLFGASMAAFPLIYTRNGPTLTYKEGPLAGQAAIRGAYINTASKDYKSDPIVGNAPIGRES